MKLLVATCRGQPSYSLDDATLHAALVRQGIEPAPTPWQDIVPDATPVLLRTPWDYAQHRAAFQSWIEALAAAATPCWNPPEIVLWNLDKVYLLELEAAGHAIIPTATLPQYDENAVRAVARDRGWTSCVAKPRIGCAAEGLTVLSPEGVRTFDSTGNVWAPNSDPLPQGAILVSPLLDMTGGEWSLFYFDGVYSHTVCKHPKAGDVRVQEEHGGRTVAAEPPSDARRSSDAVVAEMDVLYARVDGVMVRGQFQIMEVELIEPELYFRYAPQQVDVFAAALARRMRS